MNFEGMNILVVEDEEMIRELLVEELEDQGFQVCEAGSGNKAVEIIKQNKFDLIITDYHMDDGSGLELIDQIKELNLAQDTPILLISGFIDVSVDSLIEKGITYYLKKPFEMESLSDQVKQMLKAA